VKAVVLVGGEGTRMLPLTETIPKPLIPLVDRPFLDHLLDHLARHGVDEAVLSSPHLEASFAEYLRGRRGVPAVTWITEASPLGTGGAVAGAAAGLGLDETFLVMNGDILTDLDLTAIVEAHRAARATATIAVSPVDDARPFGLVDVDGEGRVREFREKPAERVSGLVNTGTYVLEPDAVADVAPGQAVSIEREVFPQLLGGGAMVLGFVSDLYWMDLGTPAKYLRATFDLLEGRVAGMPDYPAPFVDPSAGVSLRARLGRWVVIGPGGEVGDEAEVEDAVILRDARVGDGARVRDSILGPGARVEAGATVEESVLAAGAVVPAGSVVRGERIRSAGPAPEPRPGTAPGA
jgi:mannose-1-phosphate guanylyltransferase